MNLLAPAASAAPDGTVQINCRMSGHELDLAACDEALHYENLVETVSERGIYRRDIRPIGQANFVSSRRAVLAEADEIRMVSYSIGDAVRNERSRSSRLRRSARRIERQSR